MSAVTSGAGIETCETRLLAAQAVAKAKSEYVTRGGHRRMLVHSA
jgi:hypothetical protein